jgi:hypothetical protein
MAYELARPSQKARAEGLCPSDPELRVSSPRGFHQTLVEATRSLLIRGWTIALPTNKRLFWGDVNGESEARTVKHLREQRKRGFWASHTKK